MSDLIQLNTFRNGAAVVYHNSPTGHVAATNDIHTEILPTAPDKVGGRFLNGTWFDDGAYLPQTAADNSSSLTEDTVVWYTAQSTFTHGIRGITWAYDDNPSNGKLQVESPSGTVIWGPLNVTAGGPGFKNFELLAGARGQDFLVRLTYAGVSGSLAVDGHRLV